MKKALLFITAIVLSAQGFAQITLTDTSFGNPTGITDSFAYISSGYSVTGQPETNVYQTPTNFIWKLTTLAYHPTKRRWIQHIAATGYDYANRQIDTLNHKTDTVTTITPVKMPYMPEFLTDIDASGILEYGIKIPTAFGYSLSSLPGGTMTDSVKIPAQNAMYYQTTISNLLTNRNKLKFPASLPGSPWTNNYQDTIHGTMRYAAGGIIDTPLHIKSEVNETKTVVGYGKMKIRKPLYMLPLDSDTLYVVQVRCTLQVKDFYLLGATGSIQADSTMLSFIGVKGQGTTRLYYYDEYWRRGVPEPVLTVRMNDATYSLSNPNTSDANLRGLNPLDVASITSLSNINIYPNPVKNGTVTIDGIDTKWNYSIRNINGQLIQSGNLDKGDNKVQLPAGIAAGNYFMSLENENESVVKTLTIAE